MSEVTLIIITDENIKLITSHYNQIIDFINKKTKYNNIWITSTNLEIPTESEGYILIDLVNNFLINNQLCFNINKEIKNKEIIIYDFSFT